VARKGLRRDLRIEANSDCPKCAGSGFALDHYYDVSLNKLRVNITVCKCVHIGVVDKPADKL
jgi:hypothetical protein